MKKIIDKIIVAVFIVFILWFVLSWLEVVCKNLDPDPVYSALNFFKVFLGIM